MKRRFLRLPFTFVTVVIASWFMTSCCFQTEYHYLDRNRMLYLNLNDTLVYCHAESDSSARYVIDFVEQQIKRDEYRDECPELFLEYQTVSLVNNLNQRTCEYNLLADEEKMVIFWDGIGYGYNVATEIDDSLQIGDELIHIDLRLPSTYMGNPVTSIDYSYSHGVVRYWYGEDYMELDSIISGAPGV